MAKYRIVRASAKSSNNQFIRELYDEIFFVEQWITVVRGFFRKREVTRWVRISEHLSERTAEGAVQKLLNPPTHVETSVIKVFE